MKNVKKLISVILALTLALALAIPAMTAFAADVNYVPTILVGGRNRNMPIYTPEGEKVFPIGSNLKTEDITNAVMHCLPYLGVGMISGNYDAWVDEFYKAMAPYYENILCDGNGDIAPTSLETKYDYSNPVKGNYNECEYCFDYDWRIDPCQTAEYLDTFIDNVLAKTDAKKVSIVGRCYGCNVLSAYLYAHGIEKIQSVVYYVSASQGSSLRASEIFAGKFDINSVAIENALQTGKIEEMYESVIDDPAMRALINSSLSLLNTLNSLNVPMSTLTDFVNKVYPMLAPKLIPATYGSFASIWATVAAEDYEQAKKLVFAGQEEEYAGLIAKIDHYHYDIQAHEVEMLQKYKDQGMGLGIVVGYNVPSYLPFTVSAMANGDATVLVKHASFGATAADYGSELSEKELEGVDEKYISSDHIINASTCAFPDNTWFIKNYIHSIFPTSIDKLNVTIAKNSGMTVDTDPTYPQFLKYDEETQQISPLEDQPTGTTIVGPTVGFLQKIFNFIKAFFAMIGNLFK